MQQSTERVLALFDEISAIPRCSGKERALSDWLVRWAGERGLECLQDGVLNVLIRVPGTGSLADAPPVALQGHLDMVCEKTPDSGHDFDRDPIQPVVEGEWLTADRTTLGADNGIAVALALAIATEEFEHPPLELLFTTEEETGLTGAQKLSGDWLHARVLLNLDSEDEGVLTIGCAGGLNSQVTLPVDFSEPKDGLTWMRLGVEGLQGGHSGVDIHHDRANANVLVARVARDLYPALGASVADFSGGSAHNAIPRDAAVVLGFSGGTEVAEKRVAEWQQTLSGEYHSTDPGLKVTLRPAELPSRTLTNESAERLINVVLALPHGVVRMSRHIDGLVETSTNLATIRTDAGNVTIITSQRSSSESQLEAIAARIAAVARLGRGTVVVNTRYPPWEPDMESPLLRQAREVYTSLYDAEPVVEVIHAGLECGVIGARYPEMQMISLGPTITLPHSPDERMYLPSLARTWDYLTTLLSELK